MPRFLKRARLAGGARQPGSPGSPDSPSSGRVQPVCAGRLPGRREARTRGLATPSGKTGAETGALLFSECRRTAKSERCHVCVAHCILPYGGAQ
eukprot:934465-Prymnesium_polylepis.1